MEPQTLLGNFKVDKIYKFLVYTGTIVLFASFFFDIKDFDVHILRQITYRMLLMGMVIWFVDEITNKILHFFSEYERFDGLREETTKEIVYVTSGVKLISYLIVLSIGTYSILKLI